jgi:hypothetical protein
MTSPSQRQWPVAAGVGRPHERVRFGETSTQGEVVMPKSLQSITDVIRNPKHPFRQVDDRPDKPKKHRYERRKIREILRFGDWSQEAAT